jgi:3D (Asp-Asp-Asp) domain-containing protein
MRKHTLKENIISGLIGASLAIPISLVAINNPTQTKASAPIVSYEIATVNACEKIEVIEDNVAPMVATPKVIAKKQVKKADDKKELGRFKVTAYCHCVRCCGKSDGITASGTKVKEGRTIAVDPDVIPLGSKVELNGNTYIAEDIGGAVKGNHIDLYFNSHEEALKWGVQYKKIYLMED